MSNENKTWGKWWTYLIVATLVLCLGYFSGREHLKYQLATVFASAFNPEAVPQQQAVRQEIEQQTTEQQAEPKKNNIDIELVDELNYSVIKGEFSEFYRLSFSLKNNMNKGVKLVEGDLRFGDLLGEEMFRATINRDTPIPANSVAKYSGDYQINKYMASDLRLKTMKTEDVKASVEMRKVVLEDNTILAN